MPGMGAGPPTAEAVGGAVTITSVDGEDPGAAGDRGAAVSEGVDSLPTGANGDGEPGAGANTSSGKLGKGDACGATGIWAAIVRPVAFSRSFAMSLHPRAGTRGGYQPPTSLSHPFMRAAMPSVIRSALPMSL
jgi:hypothetical protein